ncbi:MAG: TIGR02117 family protein [Croceibacterium sp.]
MLAGLALAMVVFTLTGWIGSAIPRNSNWREPRRGVEIMVETNGVHTALVLPLVTPEKDWRGEFPDTDLALPSAEYTHLSISWGEREVFLNTPTWWDLRPITVLRIMGIGGAGLIHVAHYVRPAPADDIRAIRLSSEQYRRLIAGIERTLPRRHIRHPGYGAQDAFYDAPGHYTARNTCNQWTSDRLAEAGVRTGWWTPFAGGVMKWVPRPRGIG